MDPNTKMVSCRRCKKSYTLKSIVQHAQKKKGCKETYSKDQLTDLKEHSTEISDAWHRMKMKERYQRKKQEIAQKYQKSKS